MSDIYALPQAMSSCFESTAGGAVGNFRQLDGMFRGMQEAATGPGILATAGALEQAPPRATCMLRRPLVDAVLNGWDYADTPFGNFCHFVPFNFAGARRVAALRPVRDDWSRPEPAQTKLCYHVILPIPSSVAFPPAWPKVVCTTGAFAKSNPTSESLKKELPALGAWVEHFFSQQQFRAEVEMAYDGTMVDMRFEPAGGLVSLRVFFMPPGYGPEIPADDSCFKKVWRMITRL